MSKITHIKGKRVQEYSKRELVEMVDSQARIIEDARDKIEHANGELDLIIMSQEEQIQEIEIREKFLRDDIRYHSNKVIGLVSDAQRKKIFGIRCLVGSFGLLLAGTIALNYFI